MVGPARPDDAKIRPWPTTGVGINLKFMPRAVQSSSRRSVVGGNAAWLLTINSSRSPVVIYNRAAPADAFAARRLPDGLRRLSNAPTNAD